MGDGERMASRQVGDRSVIPVFPLGTVLVPGLVLPLHIFEPRYRALMSDLQVRPESERGFGVVAIREGHEVGATGARALYEVGTFAMVREIDAYDDGRFDIVTNGDARFRVVGLAERGTDYLMAVVEWLGEVDGGTPGEAQVLGQAVARRFDIYRGLLASAGAVEAAQMLSLPEDPQVLSYLISAAMVLDLSDRQVLLAADSTTDRLRRELALLSRESTLVRELPSLPAIDLARTPSGLN
jgi:Lon protease-like protein